MNSFLQCLPEDIKRRGFTMIQLRDTLFSMRSLENRSTSMLHAEIKIEAHSAHLTSSV